MLKRIPFKSLLDVKDVLYPAKQKQKHKKIVNS